MRFLPLTLALVFLLLFIYVVLFIDYPESLTTASRFQLTSFFLPLFLFLFFSINYFFKNNSFSLLISFGVILLLILQALDTLNIVSALLVIASIGLFLNYLKTIKKDRSLTSGFFIPKLNRFGNQSRLNRRKNR